MKYPDDKNALKLYHYKVDGGSPGITGLIIVRAKNGKTALREARKFVKAHNDRLHNAGHWFRTKSVGRLELVTTYPESNPAILHFDDGEN